jgi:lipopolysaccharide/colanic/teichoic acid biosynthesis glycosyltransferase
VLSYVNFLDIHEVYEHMFDRVPLEAVNYSLIAEANRGSVTFYDICKRLIDMTIAIALALVTFPFFPIIALLIKLDHKGPVFITQQRVGKRGKVIDMYKFRTMTASDEGKWLPDQTENRVTRIGAFLRKSRIDELPQLVNVIKGDISLIGPRPDIIGLGEKLVNTIPFYMSRYAVLPGLSGWAQIQQKPPQSIEETELRFSYDLFYVKNRSLFLDIRIALRTLKTLLSRTGM